MFGCLSAVCVLGLIVLALLIMVQAVTVEQVMEGLGKVFLAFVALIAVLCVAKSLFLAIVVPALHWLAIAARWAAILAVAAIVVWFVTNIAAGRVIKGRTGRKADPTER